MVEYMRGRALRNGLHSHTGRLAHQGVCSGQWRIRRRHGRTTLSNESSFYPWLGILEAGTKKLAIIPEKVHSSKSHTGASTW